MRFIDLTHIHVSSGKGGDGVVRFRKEKFVPEGGPAGGDGGDGGQILIVGDEGLHTLLDLRMQQRFKAEPGQPGGNNRRTGARGADREIRVPVGTQVYDEDSDHLIADITQHGQVFIAAHGGKGGLGNPHFATSTNQTPRKSTDGGPAEQRSLRLELKLIADVGLVGFPNAGKSTLISKLSAARPKIADYPFTTLIPNLGVVRVDLDHQFVMADIPGLIDGAAEGAGLGHQFLRHVERTRLFLHLVAVVEFDGRSPFERYQALNSELEAYDAQLGSRTQVILLTKVDAAEDPSVIAEAMAPFVDAKLPVMAISSVTGEGLKELRFEVWRRLQESKELED